MFFILDMKTKDGKIIKEQNRMLNDMIEELIDEGLVPRKNTVTRIFLLIIFLMVFINFPDKCMVLADTIYLKNSDRISGAILDENDNMVVIETEVLGILSINREYIARIVMAQAEQKADEKPAIDDDEAHWERKVSLGYNATTGNTETKALSMKAIVNRKREKVDELTLKGEYYLSTSDNKIDAQKWYGLARYAVSFGREKKWYRFYKTEIDHDRFANITVRAIPAAGLGYWIMDRPDGKLLLEAAGGVTYTDFRDNTEDAYEVVLIPRVYFEKKLFGNTKITQDFFIYPEVTDFGNYRWRSETSVTSPIADHVSIELSLIHDYNSNPPSNTEKEDIRLISSIVYGF